MDPITDAPESPTESKDEVFDEPEDLSTLTPIQNRYTFWYRYDSGRGTTNYTNYNQSIKKILSFQSVERFWTIYDHMKRPAEYKDIKAVEYHLFKDGINPFWEDAQNKNGGKWMMRLRKGIAARYWEDILLAVIGEQFDVGAEICGAVLSVRSNEDIISIWNRTADNTEAVNKIRDQIRRIVRLPDIIPLEYKVHASSLQDKSSYRNPNMVFRASTRPQGGGDRRYAGGHNRGGQGSGEGGEGGGYRENREGGGGYVRGSGHHNQERPNWKSGGQNRWNNERGTYHREQHQGEESGEGAESKPREREHTQRRERSDYVPRDRNDGGDGGGWRRAPRGESDPTPSSQQQQHHSGSRPAGSGEVRPPPAPSSNYTAGSGSFASRLKGESSAAKPADAPPVAPALSTGEGETTTRRVKNPFAKE